MDWLHVGGAREHSGAAHDAARIGRGRRPIAAHLRRLRRVNARELYRGIFGREQRVSPGARRAVEIAGPDRDDQEHLRARAGDSADDDRASDRASRSITDHIRIIEALEARDTERVEQLVRQHSVDLAVFVDAHFDFLD